MEKMDLSCSSPPLIHSAPRPRVKLDICFSCIFWCRLYSSAKGIGESSTEKGKGSLKDLHPGLYEPSGRVKGWRVEFRLRSPDRAKIWLGTFKSKEKAMRAYDASQYFLGRSPHYYDYPPGFFCELVLDLSKVEELKQYVKEMATKYAESTKKMPFRASFRGSGCGTYQEHEEKQESCQEDSAPEPSEELGVVDYEVAGAVDTVSVPVQAPSPSTSQYQDFGEVESQHNDQPPDVEMGMDNFSFTDFLEWNFDPYIPNPNNMLGFFEPIQGSWGPDLHAGCKCDSTCNFASHDSGKVHMDTKSNDPLQQLAEIHSATRMVG